MINMLDYSYKNIINKRKNSNYSELTKKILQYLKNLKNNDNNNIIDYTLLEDIILN